MGAKNREGIGLSYRPANAGIFKQSIEARNRVGIGGVDSLESIPRLIKSLQIRDQATYAGGTDSLETILGLLKSLKIRAQCVYCVLYLDCKRFRTKCPFTKHLTSQNQTYFR
jgi:hypothetical protein